MAQQMERRPGIAYRRPDGDPTQLIVEAAGESRLSTQSLPESNWLDVVAPDDRSRLCDALADESVNVTYRLTADEDTVWVQERGTRTEHGDIVGYLFPADEQVKRRKQLEQQREQLAEFANVVSHDLRNPLSVAVANIELASDMDGEAVAERLERAEDALGYMDELISDLLALAREGRSVEETNTAELRTVVDQAWRTVGAPDGVALVADGPLPVIECDQNRLRQALENLFRNAIEHGAPDEIRLEDSDHHPGDNGIESSFETQDGGDSNPAFRVSVGALPDGFYVADDGTGVDPSAQDAIFEPGHSTDADGTGFGLAIVERVAEAHDWDIAVTESRDGGARFEFTGVDMPDSDEQHRGG